MKVTIWVFTGHLLTLNTFVENVNYRPELSGKTIKWLKFPDSVGSGDKSFLFCQVELSYKDYVRLESKFPYQDLETDELRKPEDWLDCGNGNNKVSDPK